MSGGYYHKEIDGLRAISVAVIVLFHLQVPQFSGGFIGVDVFFVVSGFLISQIIIANLQSGQFSFRDFYVRRIARIIPALAVTVLLTLVGASILQQPQALVHTATQGIFALLSVSNFFFWAESNYWAPTAESFALLHTWSLGVEEQFYLVYPFMLYLVHKVAGTRGIGLLLLVMLVAGSLANEWVWTLDRSAAFYFSPLRFYEFAAGGLGAILFDRAAALRSHAWLAGTLTVAGILLIVYSAVTLNPQYHALPGLVTLIPVAGTLLVILGGATAPARLLLSNRLSSWLGKVSYSLYLVHWPIIVFYRYRFGGHLSVWEQVALVLVICVAAELLCRGVERRFRLTGRGEVTASGLSARRAMTTTASLVGITVLVSLLALYSEGWPGRLSAEERQLLSIDIKGEVTERRRHFEQRCAPHDEPLCGQRDPRKTNILLIGDSRVLDLYMALEVAYPDAAIRASSLMGCASVFDAKASVSRYTPDCPALNAKRLQAVLDAPDEDVVFLANDLNVWRVDAILETVVQLRDAGKTVYLLGQFNKLEGRNPVELVIDARRFGADETFTERFLIEDPFFLDRDYADKVRAAGATYISNKPFFFNGNYHLDDPETGRLLTLDGKHLSNYGARQFGLYLREHYPLP